MGGTSHGRQDKGQTRHGRQDREGPDTGETRRWRNQTGRDQTGRDQTGRDQTREGPHTGGTTHGRDHTRERPHTGETTHGRDQEVERPDTGETRHGRDQTRETRQGTDQTRETRQGGTRYRRDQEVEGPDREGPDTGGTRHGRDHTRERPGGGETRRWRDQTGTDQTGGTRHGRDHTRERPHTGETTHGRDQEVDRPDKGDQMGGTRREGPDGRDQTWETRHGSGNPIRELCQRVRALNKQRHQYPRILLHTDAAQALGKVPVDARDLEVDYLTIVGHKFYGPRIGALYVQGPESSAPLYPMLFGGGQERNFRPGTENTAMIAGLGKAAELVSTNLSGYCSHMLSTRLYLEQRLKAVFGESKLRFNSHFPGSECLPNTCNVSILGPGLEGRKVLSCCKRLLASVGAACHSNRGDRPSHILLSCGVPPEVASNALRLSVGRNTSREDVEQAVQDLRAAVTTLELASMLA